MHHLDTMLDIAQEPVGLGQRRGDLRLDPLRLSQRPKCYFRLARPQRRHATAGDQLLRLGEKFDLADAAAAKLDVVALYCDRPMALVDMDLALD
ncbi:hypothetical protein D3C87_1658760 [compost metagenome]